MASRARARLGALVRCGWVLVAAWVALPAVAERADRRQPMTLESDRPCVVDYNKNTSTCSGNVVITQGTLRLQADQLQVREGADGHQTVIASGTAGQPATFRQKRDDVDEHVEGRARQITYDGRAGVLRFEGSAMVRRLRGTAVAEEIQGSAIRWDSQAEVFTVQGGNATADNPSGRVRAVITPRLTEEPAPSGSRP